MTVHELIAKVQAYNPDADAALIAKAYAFAEQMHAGQFRRSGEPYFVHPVGVATIIADMRLDTASIVTGLLHDTVEDTPMTVEQVAREFGEEVGAAPFVNENRDIGRNDPCPCGSGKKYKHCCGR